MFVTHDQEEALTLSDRIAVMSHGDVLEISMPAELYEAPKSRFVADFIGTMNFFECVAGFTGSRICIRRFRRTGGRNFDIG